MFTQTKKTIYLILVVTFLTFCDGMIAEADNVAKQTAAGNDLYQTEDFAGAVEKYKQALKIDPESGIINFNVGSAYYKAGEFESAVEHLQRSVLTDDDQLRQRAYYNLGNALYQHGRGLVQKDKDKTIELYEQAIREYDKVIKANPDDEDAQHNRKIVQDELDRLKQQSSQQNQQNQQNQDEQEQDQDSESDNQDSNDQQNQSDQNENSDQNDQSDNQDQSDDSQQNENQEDQSNSENQDDDSQDQEQNQDQSDDSQDESQSDESSQENQNPPNNSDSSDQDEQDQSQNPPNSDESQPENTPPDPDPKDESQDQPEEEPSDQDSNQDPSDSQGGGQSGLSPQPVDISDLTASEAEMMLRNYQQSIEPSELLNFNPPSRGVPVLKDW